jgi:ribose transport system substrate-binding protein
MSTNRVLATLLVAAVAAGACRGSDPEAGKRLRIAVIPKGTTHEFWQAIHAGAVKAERDLQASGTPVEIIWKGPLREDDREDQVKVVENFINMRVKGIALAPLDSQALVPVVTDAVRARIPVVIFDSDLKSDDKVSYVATDNYLGGKLAGEHMGKILGGKGSVIMLRYAEGSESTQQREQGFLDAVAKFPEIKVVSSNQYGGATTETAFKASENLLTAHKGADGALTAQAIFCPNESTAFGMLRALEDGGYAGKVKFIGFDSSAKLVDAMAKGQMEATVVQDPIKMGYLAVKAMVDHLQGKPVEKRVDTGATLITRENMNEPRMKELLAPDYKKWLKE